MKSLWCETWISGPQGEDVRCRRAVQAGAVRCPEHQAKLPYWPGEEVDPCADGCPRGCQHDMELQKFPDELFAEEPTHG